MTVFSNDNSFTKKFRLRSQKDFDQFFEKSKSKSLGSVKMFYLMKKDVIHPRLGLAISGRYFNSVQRNSLKRTIRNFFRISKDKFLMMDVVITVRYSSEHALTWRLFLNKVKNDLEQLLSVLNNINK